MRIAGLFGVGWVTRFGSEGDLRFRVPFRV